MKTLVNLERLATDKWRLSVRRADPKGNVTATAPVDGTLDQIRALAAKSLKAWTAADEMLAEAKRAIAKRNRGRR